MVLIALLLKVCRYLQSCYGPEDIDRLLITKEAYWSAQLFSLAPHGLNKTKEFHSKNRICYN